MHLAAGRRERLDRLAKGAALRADIPLVVYVQRRAVLARQRDQIAPRKEQMMPGTCHVILPKRHPAPLRPVKGFETIEL